MLPSGFGFLLVAFAPLFRSSVWDYAQVLLLGAILAPGRRTVSSAVHRARGTFRTITVC